MWTKPLVRLISDLSIFFSFTTKPFFIKLQLNVFTSRSVIKSCKFDSLEEMRKKVSGCVWINSSLTNSCPGITSLPCVPGGAWVPLETHSCPCPPKPDCNPNPAPNTAWNRGYSQILGQDSSLCSSCWAAKVQHCQQQPCWGEGVLPSREWGDLLGPPSWEQLREHPCWELLLSHKRFWFSLLLHEQSVPSVPGDWQPIPTGTLYFGSSAWEWSRGSSSKNNQEGDSLLQEHTEVSCASPQSTGSAGLSVREGNCRAILSALVHLQPQKSSPLSAMVNKIHQRLPPTRGIHSRGSAVLARLCIAKLEKSSSWKNSCRHTGTSTFGLWLPENSPANQKRTRD